MNIVLSTAIVLIRVSIDEIKQLYGRQENMQPMINENEQYHGRENLNRRLF